MKHPIETVNGLAARKTSLHSLRERIGRALMAGYKAKADLGNALENGCLHFTSPRRSQRTKLPEVSHLAP